MGPAVPRPDLPDPGDPGDYGRAAARLSGLAIDEAWWPNVQRHLATLVEHAASVEAFVAPPGGAPIDQSTPAPVFHP